MKSEDLKNSEELLRTVVDESELNDLPPVDVPEESIGDSGSENAEAGPEETELADNVGVEESGDNLLQSPDIPEEVSVPEEAVSVGEDAELSLSPAGNDLKELQEIEASVQDQLTAEPEESLVPETNETVTVEEVVTAEEAPEIVIAEMDKEMPAAEESGEAPGKEERVAEESEEEEFSVTDEGDLEAQVDYNDLTLIELVNLIRETVGPGAEDSPHNIDSMFACYFRKVRENNEALRKAFVANGGNEDDFIQEEDPYSQEVKELLKKYKQLRFEFSKKLDAEKENNLQKKYEIIEEIKNLLNKEESINKTFQEFRELQKKWYALGQVPQSKMKDLWDTYHFHVENFYDYIKINKELRDLDLKKNLETKMELCEKTEELLMEPSIIKAFNALQKYHEEWRETGPVPTDKKDEIWERFKAATSKINQKHQEYFDKRKLEQKKNLDAKIALCEKAEEISSLNFDSHREWDEKSRELVELQKVWKTIGFAPRKENNRIYNRFRAACDKFFINKREFYSKNKDIQQNNLQMKIDLCLEAETLKESTDWKKATQQFIDIQKRWKEIGPIPRKSSDAIWKRFRSACDYFFEKKAAHFSDIDGEQFDNLKLKEEIIAEVENFSPEGDPAESLKKLREFQRRWTEIGHVPLKNKEEVQQRFRKAINRQFDALNVDDSNRNVFNFRSKIESMTDNARGLSKVRSEREKYMIKLKQLETDLILLDNNIGFFANSKNAQALIADVNQKIQETKEKIEQLKEKIKIIDDLDKSEY